MEKKKYYSIVINEGLSIEDKLYFDTLEEAKEQSEIDYYERIVYLNRHEAQLCYDDHRYTAKFWKCGYGPKDK